jgi:putative FmdB family regulatory protein
MPIYEYSCNNCGHHFEEFQTMSEKPLVKCPKCGQETLKRLIGAGSGVIFKGSGFYGTDYKKAKEIPKTKEAKEKSNIKNQKSKTQTKDEK